MTTEEIMRMQAPKTLGEWAFQGFPGRRKREGRARELAAEGMQQRVAEERSLADIRQGRAMEFLKEQARIAEEQARYETALRIQAGQILGREGVQNALSQAQGMVPIGENAAIGQEMLRYGAQDQMELLRRKQEENAMRQEVHQSGLDLQASQAFENRGRGAGYMFPRQGSEPRPFAVPQGSVVFDAQGRPSYAVGLDANSNPMANPLFAPDAPSDARRPASGQPGLGPVTTPPKAGGWFGNNPGKTLMPGATGKTSQVQTGPNVDKGEEFQQKSLVSSVADTLGQAYAPYTQGITDPRQTIGRGLKYFYNKYFYPQGAPLDR